MTKSFVRWKKRDLAILRANFATATKYELFRMLEGRYTLRAIVNQGWRHALVKDPRHVARVGALNNRHGVKPERVGPPPREEPRQRLQLRQG